MIPAQVGKHSHFKGRGFYPPLHQTVAGHFHGADADIHLLKSLELGHHGQGITGSIGRLLELPSKPFPKVPITPAFSPSKDTHWAISWLTEVLPLVPVIPTRRGLTA